MVIIALLNLPLELPPESPARIKGDETFLTNLPEWVARCQQPLIYPKPNADGTQAKRTKAACPTLPGTKRMVPTHSAHWAACASSVRPMTP